ncbi:MAG TPA: histidine kinase dimerization/phospho-acceptor domain-containing protein, partial [Ktedonobacterales bacterium]|nr:histidine kinase dimerization/phospho-acceptor domain-containing protein [Ktedonobacterales bacterium]
MTTPASPSNLHSETRNAAAALDLARLVVKAHACTTSADVAAVSRALLDSLLTAVGAAHGALALTQLAEGAQHMAIRVLAADAVDEALVAKMVAQVAQRPENHPALRKKDWVRIAVPLGESAPRPDGESLRVADAAHMLLLWDEEQTGEQRAHSERAVNGLRDAIAAVVVSVLATERRIALERTVEARAGEHLNAELLGTVSHELRSPLAVIKGYATTLLRHERRLSRTERHEFLAAIDEATDQLDAIITRLLRFSTLETTVETRHAPLDRFAVDLVPIV